MSEPNKFFTDRLYEIGHHVPKLTLLEIFPLAPFLQGKSNLSIVEVGGNIGLWCEAFFNVYGDFVERYDTFEPLPGNIALFEQRIVSYLQSHRHKIQLHKSGVGDRNGELELHFNTPVSTIASAVVKEMKLGGVSFINDKTIKVPVVTIDDLLASDPKRHVDLVKIDVEGFEWNVLQGMQNSIESGRISNIYFEFGMHQGHINQTFKQFFDFFSERGFKFYRQEVGRNYFGLNLITRYNAQFENFSSMNMMLASRVTPDARYGGPRVTGRIN